MATKRLDLIGKRFGRLKVIKFSHMNRNWSYWKCVCDCGNKNVIVRGSYLTKGTKNSCGCYAREQTSKRSLINLMGRTFGKLTVIKRDKNTNDNKPKWLCRCECGRKVSIRGASLKDKRRGSKSCGKCLRIRNLVGKIFGDLTVIKLSSRKKDYISKTGRRDCKWLCLCTCGKRLDVRGTALRCGNTKSCGHYIKESRMATSLKKYCKGKYGAKLEYKVMKNPKTNHFLPFDIYIPRNNIFIEIHGQQHYIYSSLFYKTEIQFKHRKFLDKIKKKYAVKNGVYIEIDLRKIKSIRQANNIIRQAIKG